MGYNLGTWFETINEDRKSLGLNSKIQKKFSEEAKSVEEDIVDVSEEDLINLYDMLGEVTTEWQGIRWSKSGDWGYIMGKTGSSYAKVIWEVTEGLLRFTCNTSWGQEGLQAIEFWDYRIKKDIRGWKNRLGGDILYWNEFRERFLYEKQNFILDWYIPTTVKILKENPEFKHFFIRRMRK